MPPSIALLTLGVAACLLSHAVQAAPVPLASTVLRYTATGSPNTISGTWSAGALDVDDAAEGLYFELEVLSFTSGFGPAASLGFDMYSPGNSRSLALGALCPVGVSCVGSTTIGAISVVDVLTSPQWMARDFLLRLDPDSALYATSGAATVSFNSGGPFAEASGDIRITAFGEPQQVPEPSTFLLMLTAAIGSLTFRRARGPKEVGLHPSE